MWIFSFFGGGLVGRGRVSTGRRVHYAPRGERSSAVLVLPWRDLLRRVASWNLLVAAPTASTDAPSTRGRRVPSRVVRASRPLLRRAGASFFFRRVSSWFFTFRPRRCNLHHAGFTVLFCSVTKKLPFVQQCSRSWSRDDRGESDFVTASHGRVRNGPRHLCTIAATAAHPRRKKSARDEGSAP